MNHAVYLNSVACIIQELRDFFSALWVILSQYPNTSFPPVTSTNVEISPQKFPTLRLIKLATLV